VDAGSGAQLGRPRQADRHHPQRAGVLGQVCTVIGEAGGNIVQLRMHHRQADFFDVDIDVDVNDAST